MKQSLGETAMKPLTCICGHQKRNVRNEEKEGGGRGGIISNFLQVHSSALVEEFLGASPAQPYNRHGKYAPS